MMIRFLFTCALILAAVISGKTQDDLDFNTKIDVSYSVKKVNKINTRNAEFSPVITGSDFVFVSDRESDLVKYGESGWKKKRHLNVYKAGFKSPKDDSVMFTKVEPFNDRIPDYFHEGPIGFHPSGNYAVITRVITERRTNKPQLYLSKKENNKWSKPERLPFCGNDFSYGHACFSEDGKTMFFASDQLGTLGGKDIFSCSFNEGKFGTPFNLGDKINTDKDEMYPFFQDNKIYFSSNREGTLGGLDIYKSILKNGRYENAVNAGNTINSTADDFSFFLTLTGRNGFFASGRDGNDDIYFFTVTETATILSKNITGKFSYTRLQEGFPAGLDLQLLDEAGNVVQTTTTDANGGFKFSNLPTNQDYTIKVINMGDDLTLHIFNKDGQEVAVLMSDTKGSFVYKKLDPNDVGTLSFMELEDTDMSGKKTGRISGQFLHERMRDVSVSGLNVMLVDEAGNIYASTKTDRNGNFTFSKLPPDQNLFIKTDDASEDLKLLLYNKKDEVIADLKRRGQGSFIFRRIDSKLENSLTFMDNPDTGLFPSSYANLRGKYKFSELGEAPRELDFMVLDEAGNVLRKGTTDNKGNFLLTGLPPKDVYIFKLDEKDAGLTKKGMQLQMLDRYDQELQMIDPNESGLHVFDRKPKTVAKPSTDVVYFDKASYTLDDDSKKMLKPLIERMKAQPALLVQLDGHADASYVDSYNDQLSMRRMLAVKQYFVHNGISSKRIKGFYHGETKLANACTDAALCTEAQNWENRRCEVKLY